MTKTQPLTSLQNVLGSFAQPGEGRPRLAGKMVVNDPRSWDRVLSEFTRRSVAEGLTAPVPPATETQAQTPRTGLGHQAPAAR